MRLRNTLNYCEEIKMLNTQEKFNSKKIVEFSQAQFLIKEIKESGKKVGLCHGGFDLLHPGHVKHFQSARELCDILIVSITSDTFVNARKGNGRPIYNQTLRAYMIASLACVDHVVVSDFNTGIETIKALKPSYYIKGPDYIDKDDEEINAERQAIKEVSGEIKYTNDAKLSTSQIIDYIKKI
jgi:rfaE bifunctional protein nucleotidyltransferase chain/domain